MESDKSASRRQRKPRLPVIVEPSCLYPLEAELGRLVLGTRAALWPAARRKLEPKGLPPVDRMMGGRYWPAILSYFDHRHRISKESAVAIGERRPLASCLFPTEAEIARLVMGDRWAGWEAIAADFETKDKLPRIDPIVGGRYWRGVLDAFDRRNMVGGHAPPPRAPLDMEAYLASRKRGRRPSP